MKDSEMLRILANHFNERGDIAVDLNRMADKADTWGGNFPIKNNDFIPEEYIEDDRSEGFLRKLYERMDSFTGRE
jgi:hypothetical protein